MQLRDLRACRDKVTPSVNSIHSVSQSGPSSSCPPSAALGSCCQAQDPCGDLGKSFVSLEMHRPWVFLHKLLSLGCFALVLST